MTGEELKEVYTVVDRLNEYCYEKNKKYIEDFGNPFHVKYDGTSVAIYFLDQYVWDNDNEPREVNNDEYQDYEDLEQYCFKEMKKLVTNLTLLCL